MQVVCDFEVVDETADWIVVDKPAPLLVHPANGRDEPSLLGGLEELLACDLAGGGWLSIMTRLDRETSGLVLVAKHRRAARELAREFEERRVRKGYHAVVRGAPEWEERTVDAPMRRAGEVSESAIWLRQRVHEGGRPCETRFVVEQRFRREGADFAVIRCMPETGRMHQIRVHLEYLGHPLVGDKIYGGNGAAYLIMVAGGDPLAADRDLLLSRQALHASSLAIDFGGRRWSWHIGMPEDLTQFIAGEKIPERYGDTLGDG